MELFYLISVLVYKETYLGRIKYRDAIYNESIIIIYIFLPNASYGTKLNTKPIICPGLPLHFTPKEEHVFPLVAPE
jgi:hypothetical protein